MFLLERLNKVHFIGIGGYGMSALAIVMVEMGYTVTGSDIASQELTKKLVAKGATVYIGHSSENCHGADLVVYSAATSIDNVERVEARRLHIPTIHRAELLAQLLTKQKGIAIAGAHGKTTTSSIIAFIMEKCTYDPTYVIGGEVVDFGTNAKAGQGKYIVAEADESDGSFLQYRPWLAVVTNIEADHLENYNGNFEKLKQAYVQFLNQITSDGFAVLCVDDHNIRHILPELRGVIKTFGIDTQAHYTATNIELGDRCVCYTLNDGVKSLGKINLAIPGKHNVYNSMAAIVVCLEAGIAFDDIVQTIGQFQGAKRRFQVLGHKNDILVVDDYAHHPTEIEATLAAAKATGKRIIAIFQPQRYSRTFFLLDAFSRAFDGADEVLITDIYAPVGEEQIEGIHSAKLVELIVKNSNSTARLLPTKEEVIADVLPRLQRGDVVITMGAGDVWKIGVALVERLCK